MSEGTQRRLAAIVSADVVGYSRRMGEDEEGTIGELRRLRSEILEPEISKSGGNLLKSMGDGWIVEFPSARSAVSCALAIQRRFAKDTDIKLRVGIHLGDISVAEEDIYGDGINIAARLQELSDAGAIVISDFARRSVDATLAREFISIGVRDLKNIAEPIGVYAWGMAEDRPQADKSQSDESEIVKIFYAGFQEIGGGDDANQFAAGLNAAIHANLAGQSKVAVCMDRNDADLIIQGTLQLVGKRYRSTIQLSDNAGDRQYKGGKYDGEIGDLFEAEDDLVQRIYTTIRFGIFEFERSKIDTSDLPLEQLDNRALLVRASQCFAPMQKILMRHAGEILKFVLDRDPNNTSALSMSATSCLAETVCGWREPNEEDRRFGLQLAKRAVQSNNQNDYARTALSWVLLDFEKDQSGAQLAAKKAIEITPHNAQAQIALGNALNCAGEFDDGLAIQLKAIEAMKERNLFPTCVPYLALGLILADRHAEALTWCQLADQQVDDVPNILLPMISAAAYLEDKDHLGGYVERLLKAHPDFNLSELRIWPLKRASDWEHFVAGLRRAGLT